MANLWGIKSQETRVKTKKEGLKKAKYFGEPIRVIIFDTGSVPETQIQEPLQNKKNHLQSQEPTFVNSWLTFKKLESEDKNQDKKQKTENKKLPVGLWNSSIGISTLPPAH